MRHWTALLLCAAAGTAVAAEIKVLSAGAIEPGLRAAAAAFRKQSGHEVNIAFNTTPEIRKRIGGGDAFDVVIAPPAALDEFAGAGKVAADRVDVGRVGLGVAVRPGAPVPDISSSEALKRSVLQAESIVFNRASSGIYFEHVLKGKGREIGFGPVTEILQHREKGLKLVGPLPSEVQNYTSYSAAPTTAAANAELARVFVRYLGSPEGKALFVAAGID